jgi:AmiR/NasT family two-component response regulator
VPANEGENDLPAPEGLADTAAQRIQALADRLAADPLHNVASGGNDLQNALDEVKSLKEGLQTRTVIGEAVGLLMGRYDLSAEDAFEELVRRSSHSNRKVRVLAAEIVAEANAAAGSDGGVMKSVRRD